MTNPQPTKYYKDMKYIQRMMGYPAPMLNRLQALSEKTGMAVTEIVRRAIDEYLDRQEQKG